MSNVKSLDLDHLVREFAEFQPEGLFVSMDSKSFVTTLADPAPEFVTAFIRARKNKGSDENAAIRDLYAFLLDKRYYARSNLLYFAFDVFCSKVSLPDEILEITPLPHEEGVPLFKHKLTPGYKVE
jgi:hypothetical protein